MKRIIVLITVLFFVGCSMEDRRFYNIDGIEVTLDGDVQAARKAIHPARLLMMKTRMMNTENLEQVSNKMRLDNGTEIHVSINHGIKKAFIYAPPVPPLPTKAKFPIEKVQNRYPVLGILLGSPINVDYRLVQYQGDYFHETPVPIETQRGFLKGFFMEKDKNTSKKVGITLGELGFKTHVRLSDESQYENQSSQYTIGNSYTHPPANLLWERDFAYRTMWDAFGNVVNVDPVIFTGPGYVRQTSNDCELWSDRETETCANLRALQWSRTYTTDLKVNNVAVKSGYATLERVYADRVFVKNITIPGDLADDWPPEMIDRVAVPPGTYELWYRDEGTEPGSLVGDMYFHEIGAETKANIFEENQFAACLYHHFRYYGSDENFSYEFKLYETDNNTVNEETLYNLNPNNYGYGMVDDIAGTAFKVCEFSKRPVYVFGYFRNYFTPGFTQVQYARYGIYWNGELRLTQEFPMNTGAYGNNVQDILGSVDELGFVGYGDVSAIGILGDQELKGE
jgi:hypothetical protein